MSDDAQKFPPGDRERAARLRLALAAALACGLLLSFKLWVSTRHYPLSPVWDFLAPFPFPLDYVWLAALLGLLGATALGSRPLLRVFLVLSALLCLQDQTRWQPWFYQYFFMLAALAVPDPAGPAGEPGRRALNTCRFVVAAVYFWSGMQKVNADFFGEMWPGLVGPYLRFVPAALGGLVNSAGPLVALAEVFVGVGLLTRRLRVVAVAAALATHAFVLALFVPLGRNTVVWPWNVAMAAFVLILFWRARETWREILPNRGFVLHPAAVLLFGLLPALGFFGLWDAYLSSSLYSGNTTHSVLMLGDATAERLPPAVRAYVGRNAAGAAFISLNTWAFRELNVPPYPEPRVSRKIARHVCAAAGDAPDLTLVLRHAPGRLGGGRRVERLTCAGL